MGEFSGVQAELIGGATLSPAVSAELKDRIDNAAKNENVQARPAARRTGAAASGRYVRGALDEQTNQEANRRPNPTCVRLANYQRKSTGRNARRGCVEWD